MEITFEKLLLARDGFKVLSDENLPLKVSLAVTRVIKVLEEEFAVYTEAKNKLIRKFGEEDKSGNITVTDDNKMDFYEEHDKLLKETVKVDCSMISVDELEKFQNSFKCPHCEKLVDDNGFKIKPKILYSISDFLEQ